MPTAPTIADIPLTNAVEVDYYRPMVVNARRILSKDVVPPFCLYDVNRILQNLATFRAATRSVPLKLSVAVKACYLPSLLKMLVPHVDCFDVQSADEAMLCPDEVPISYHSPVLPTDDWLITRCSQVSLNSELQVSRLRRLWDSGAPIPDIGFRTALPQVSDQQFISTSSKFGLSEDQLVQGLSIEWPGASRPFLHHHTHSRLHGIDEAESAARQFADRVRRIQDRVPFGPMTRINIGGGWDGGCELAASGHDLRSLLDVQLAIYEECLPDVREIILEPGRALFEDAAIVVTSVVDVFTSGGDNYAILDCATNFLVPLPLARFKVVPIQTGPVASPAVFHFVDGTCSPRGILASHRIGVSLHPGDLVGIVNCGAYTYSIAGYFYGRIPPAYFVQGQGAGVLLTPQQVLESRRALFRP